MSLVKKHNMTEKQLAANRRNQSLRNGPVVDERRERIRAALPRFGYNLEAEEMAMRALGEDPADFQELLEALWEEWNPRGALQEGVVIRLARAMWLANRADRSQEGRAVRQALVVDNGRQDRLHTQMMRLKMTEGSLKSLAQSVAQEFYVTTAKDLALMQSFYQEGEVKEIGEIALTLFLQLQAPGVVPGEPDEEEKQRRLEAQSRAALQRVKQIFGLAGDTPPRIMTATQHCCPPPQGSASPSPAPSVVREAAPEAPHCKEIPRVPEIVPKESTEARAKRLYPKITEQEWDKREPVRQLLENLLTREAERCQAQGRALMKESVKGPSPYERAAEIAPSHADALLMRRTQDASMREIRRLTSLLLTMKRYECQMLASEKTAALHDVLETKRVSN